MSEYDEKRELEGKQKVDGKNTIRLAQALWHFIVILARVR